MSFTNESVKAVYVGNGANKTFAIPFTPIVDDSAETIVYLRDEADPTDIQVTLLEEGALNDYTLTGAPDADSFNVNVLLNAGFTAPTASQYIVVIRQLPLTQILNMSVSGFRPPSIELALDRLVAMVQQLNEKLTRVPILSITERVADATMVLPDPEATTVIGWDATASAFKNYTIAEIATEVEGAFDDTVYAYEGYSARFSEFFQSTGLDDTLQQILDLTYTAPSISLSASGTGTVREKGDAVTSSTLTAAITKRSDPIAEVRFYDQTGGDTLLDTQTSGGGIPSGGNSTYAWTGSFDDTQVFRAEVDDDGTSGGPTTVSSTTTFTFVYPYYYGADAAGLTAAQVATLTKDIRTSNANLTETFAPDGTEVLYFAYPASYGDLTAIYDVNNFNTIADWTKTTANITGLDGNAVSYNIYEFNNVPLAGSYDYRFVR